MNLVTIKTISGLTARLVKNTNGDRTVLVRQFDPFEDEIEITLDQAAAIHAVMEEARAADILPPSTFVLQPAR